MEKESEQIFNNLFEPMKIPESLVRNIGAEMAVATTMLMKLYYYEEQDKFPFGEDIIVFGKGIFETRLGMSKNQSLKTLRFLHWIGLIVEYNEKFNKELNREVYTVKIDLETYSKLCYKDIPDLVKELLIDRETFKEGIYEEDLYEDQ